MNTYQDYQNAVASEKIGLVILEASKRLIGFTVHSGSIYKLESFDHESLVHVSELETVLTEVFSIGTVIAGSYFHDRQNKTLYLWTTASGNPNSLYIHTTFKLFFSNTPVHTSADPGVGLADDVFYRPLLLSTSDFGVQLDSSTPQSGKSIEGSGSVKLLNNQDFWKPIFDKLYFENHRCFIYSWNRDLPIIEAKILFRGRIQKKSYSEKEVSFQLKDFLSELNNELDLGDIQDELSIRVPDEWLTYKRRRVYGYVTNMRPHNIDHMLDAYPLSGTITLTSGSASVTGIGTSFLNDFSPEDEIVVDGIEEGFAIASITSNTALTLSNDFDQETLTNVSFYVKSKNETKRYANRVFLVAGHSLREPNTIVSAFTDQSRFRLTDPTDFLNNDIITVGSEVAQIESIVGDRVTLTGSLLAVPIVGTTVIRNAVTNVRIDNTELVVTRDYTYNPTTARITLDDLAEVNVAPILSLTGTSITFTNGLRTVTGVGTTFKADVEPENWISMVGYPTEFFEVLSVESDTALTLKTPATFTDTQAPKIKRPNYYKEEETVLTCATLGISEDGTTTAPLIKTHAGIVEHIITEDAGLGDFLNAPGIQLAKEDASQRIGALFPLSYDDDGSEKVRDVIDKLCKSIFGSFIQNDDFELEFIVLKPDKPSSLLRVSEKDILKWSVDTDSRNIFKSVTVKYNRKEFEPISRGEVYLEQVGTSNDATYLAQSKLTHEVITYLIDDRDAEIMAKRFALFFEKAQCIIKFDTTLKASRLKVTSKIDFKHEKLFERFGGSSVSNRKVGAIQVNKKSISDTSIEIEDLNNKLTTAGTITENDAVEYKDSDEDARVINGYLLNDDCVLPTNALPSGDPDTFGLNLIW